MGHISPSDFEFGDDSSSRVKPNSVFLGRMLTGVHRGNQRVVDLAASRAAEKVRGWVTLLAPVCACACACAWACVCVPVFVC